MGTAKLRGMGASYLEFYALGIGLVGALDSAGFGDLLRRVGVPEWFEAA